VLVAILLISTAVAQETTAGLQGTIKDPQGLVVSKATVEVTGTALIGAKKVETDASGYYRFANLPPGDYVVTVSAQGFRTLKQSGLRLEVGKLPTLDLKLEIGGIEQTVEVTGAAPIVDVSQSKVQTVVSNEVIDAIPKGRSFQSLIQLAPGARVEPLMGGGYQIDGASNAENTYLVEGQDTGNVQTGFSNTNVPFEFIQEVQVKSGGFEAEYGGALGGVVNVIQKRGGNSWHGSVFTYYEGDMFNAVGGGSAGNAAWVTSQQKYIRKTPSTSIAYTPDEDNPNTPLIEVPGTCINVAGPCRMDRPDQYIQPKKDHQRVVEPGFEIGGYLMKDRLWLFTGFRPRINNIRRTVDNWAYAGNPLAGVPAITGTRVFNQDTQTYSALSRLDFLATSKIRLYGAWQTQYERQNGNALPNADDANGLTNTHRTQNPDNFSYQVGYVQPNTIYNTGADITVTPNLVSTTRFGYFFSDFQNRGIPEGARYRWIDVNYNYPGISSNSVTALCGTPPCQALDANYVRTTGFSTLGANLNTFFDRYWRKSLNQDLAYFKKGFLGTHNIKGGYALNKLSNDVQEWFNTSVVHMGYGRIMKVAGVDNVANCIAINQYNNANYGTNLNVTNPSSCRGLWGTVNLRDFQTTGKVGSDNHALYVQDAWTVGNTGVTLNLGVRFDKEGLPNYFSGVTGFEGINWGFGDKIAPRLGGAWDVFRNGKLKIYGSFGYFYDIMKYELPRGSFGGDYWHDCIYALDDPDYTKIQPARAPGVAGKQVYCNLTGGANGTGFGNAARPNNGFIANVDFRSPSNSVDDYRIDPNLKPMKQHESTLGMDYAFNPTLGLEVRWTRKRLDRTIEDAGFIDASGSEPFYIINPGEGIHARSGLVPASDCPDGECGAQPKAVREYDGLEFRLTKRDTGKWYGVVSYTFSRLYGNYAGLTSSDAYDGGGSVAAGGGRASPNVSRNFDEPFMQFTAAGDPALGRLATDRPHTVKMYGYYRLKWWKMETIIGGSQFIYSGTPVGSYIATGGNAFAPQFVVGRDKWVDFHRNSAPGTAAEGDLVVDGIRTRRTPAFMQTDLSITQEFKVSKTHENMRVGFEANVTNLFNQHAVVSYASQLSADGDVVDPVLHLPDTSVSLVDYPSLTKYGYDWVNVFNRQDIGSVNYGNGTVNNSYGKANLWQNGRGMRFKLKFSF